MKWLQVASEAVRSFVRSFSSVYFFSVLLFFNLVAVPFVGSQALGMSGFYVATNKIEEHTV